ncbi:uncharacterized protein PAF06_013149 [Gastrophryne carolinensis]
MAIQDHEDVSPPAIVRVTIPKVPLTRKSKQREPLALIRRKVLSHNQEVQEIRILGNEGHSPTMSGGDPGDGVRSRFLRKDAATQTTPIYCFSSVEEMVEFLNHQAESEEPVEEREGGGGASGDDHMKPDITEEDDEQPPVTSQFYLAPPFQFGVSAPSPPFPMVKRRRKQRFHCDWRGPVAVISSPNVPAHAAELRVDQDLAVSLRRQVDLNNPGPFGWQLAKLLFTEEELYGHNFNGTDQKMPLSPRRVHAIQHAFHDYFPRDVADEALAKGRTAINQGIRNMFYVRGRRDGDAL